MKKSIILSTSLILSTLAHAAQYEDFFPHYYEYCTGTQLKYQKEYFEGGEGGKGGHGFFYIHGLCKDNSKEYPQVIPCENTNTNHTGVGISLDSDFTNVAWVAIPGRDLFINGENQSNNVLKQNINHVLDKAYELDIFRNVKMKAPYVRQFEEGTEEAEKAKVLASIGTNIAINWGRELHCIKIPVTKEAVASASEYLNSVNDSYYKTGKEFKWSGLHNNCTHLAMNTTHAMGINKSIKTDQNLIMQLPNLAIPSNAYLMYVDKALLAKFKYSTNKTFYPNQVGVLIEKLTVFDGENEMFETNNLRGFTLLRRNLMRMRATPKSYERYLKEKRYTDLAYNAKEWETKYRSAQDKLSTKFQSEYLDEKLLLIRDIMAKKEL